MPPTGWISTSSATSSVCHAVAATAPEPPAHSPVDGHDVPVPHFGLVLDMKDWESLAAQLEPPASRS